MWDLEALAFAYSIYFQFCLEDENNFLENEDWLVHLDEETLLTENSVRGILNFVTANKGCR